MPMKKTSKAQSAAGLKHGFRSGLEEQVAADLERRAVPYAFEDVVVPYTQPVKERKYSPDFRLPNDTIVETKGRFVTADRQKHLLIKEQHPELTIRFLFQNPNARISKTSKTTYAMWCEKNGFEYAKAATKAKHRDGEPSIPKEWLA